MFQQREEWWVIANLRGKEQRNIHRREKGTGICCIRFQEVTDEEQMAESRRIQCMKQSKDIPLFFLNVIITLVNSNSPSV